MKEIEELSWEAIRDSLNVHGYATIKNFLSYEECDEFISQYEENSIFRKTVVMERYRFGRGEYKYFNYPLPELIEKIRTRVYPHLVPIANLWMKVLKIDIQYPKKHSQFIEICHQQKQMQPTPLILNYKKGGFNTLHQDLYGDIYFPIQLLLILDETDIDFSGGEFVMTQQIPRAQSKAIVLKPKKGDLLIFTTHFKPEKGSKGYYRVNMKHGVSEVKSGIRYALGIIFHDAIN